MARLEIPSIVVHKGGRSESRPESPCSSSSSSTVVCDGGMPSLPASSSGSGSRQRQQSLAAAGSSSSSSSDSSDMIEASASSQPHQLHRSASLTSSPSPPHPHSPNGPSSDSGLPETKPHGAYRNNNNNNNNNNNSSSANNNNRASSTKVKLLVRSHAMRESTSPPREPQNGGSLAAQPAPLECELAAPASPSSQQQQHHHHHHQQQQQHHPGKGNKLSPNSSAAAGKQQPQLNNNNESVYSNSNLAASSQSPKQMRNSATSPTCRTSSRNGSSSPSQAHQKNPVSPVNGKPESQRNNKQNSVSSNKCNNCMKNGQQQHQQQQQDRPVLLQTPVSPMRNHQGAKGGQNNHKNEQRRPNSLNVFGNNQSQNQCPNTLSVNRSNNRHKLRHQNSSSQGSYDSASPSLSRDNSTELYTDSTGTDLEQFIAETINRNQKDRQHLLKIERELIEFAKDKHKVSHRFISMSSYNRMLVHRVAAYFGMEHNVDQTGQCVIVTRTKHMRIPDVRFKEHIRDDGLHFSDKLDEQSPRQKSILKRETSSFEDNSHYKSPDRFNDFDDKRSKSFEEREAQYHVVRKRIFRDEHSNRSSNEMRSSAESSEIPSWPLQWSSSESSDSAKRLLHPSDGHNARQMRLLKVGSLQETTRTNNQRPSVSKSFSFGGYTGRGGLARGDSVMSTHSAGPRLMKQATSVEDSGASMCSRLSPSSSGYKSQSQRSDTTISPSPSPSPISTLTCHHSQSMSSQDAPSPEPNVHKVIWAVTSLSSVPRGSVIINPQTSQPLTNPDGSTYYFDPDNPPNLFNEEMEDQGPKHAELPEPPRAPAKHEGSSRKLQRSQTTKHSGSSVSSNSTSSSTTTATATTVVGVAGTTPASPTTMMMASPCPTQLTNSATSPSLPFTPPPAPPPPPPLPPAVVQQPPAPAPPPPAQPPSVQQQQQPPLVRTVPMQPYAAYIPTSEPYAQGLYQPGVAQQTVMMAPHPTHGQPAAPNAGQEEVFNQNSVYTNYTLPVQQPPLAQTGDVTELSNYFMGMGVYDLRGAGDNQAAPSHPFPQPQPQTTSQTIPNVQPIQPNYWQTTANQMPPQQAMYFVSPPGAAISVNQNPNDRQSLSQQQRFSANYSANLQTMTPSSQTNANYISSYPVTYNSMPTVTPNPGEYACQPPVQMVPAYYPGQSGIQPSPVMYRVPTPPNTPTSSQIPGVPLMYVNSGSYPPPAMMSTGTFGPQVGPNGTSPPGTYMAPAIVPNLVFRQNVPLVTGVRTSTPGSSQRASRSPTPAHEIFGGGAGDRSAQPPPRYPLPMYQGVHIVQGDMRLMHTGVPGNHRVQYAPIPSPPVIQGCPRPYRPASYSSNTSGGGTPTPFDGRNQKIRKQRSKINTLPPQASVTRPNLYQSPCMSSLSSNAPKDMGEGTVKVTITRRN